MHLKLAAKLLDLHLSVGVRSDAFLGILDLFQYSFDTIPREDKFPFFSGYTRLAGVYGGESSSSCEPRSEALNHPAVVHGLV